MKSKANKTAVIYARVSSEEQEKEGWSIPSQLKALRKLAVQNDYRVENEFVESASAKKEGRKEFSRMVEFVKENKIDTILCYKVDRLTRNPKDLITIEELGVDLIFIEGRYDPSPQGRFALSMMANMARFQVENQALDIQRGLRERIEQGGWPHRAPIGYRNDKNSASVEIDESKCFYIRQAFELYGSGLYSIKTLSRKLYEMGLRNRCGNKVYNHGIETILKNPFYYGAMKYKEKLYTGNHKPLITKDLFNQVQATLKKNSIRNKKIKHTFPFRGYLTCGECGCSITAQVQKGHNYYNCTKSRGNCSQPYIREEELETQIAAVLETIELDQELVDFMIRAAKEMKQEEINFKEVIEKNLTGSLNKIKIKEKRLLDSFLEGHIQPDIYKEKASELEDERVTIELELRNENNSEAKIFEQMENVLNMANAARQAFIAGDYENKRRILEIVSSNLILNDRQITSYQLKEPFSMIANWPKEADIDLMWT